MLRPMFALAALAWVVPQAARCDDKCEVVAEITVEAVKLHAARGCLTGSPLSCVVAAALETAAGDGLAKDGVTAGCKWTVKKVDDLMKVTIKADGAKPAEQARRARQELKQVKEFKFRPLP
jgi:hypothetical protein